MDSDAKRWWLILAGAAVVILGGGWFIWSWLGKGSNRIDVEYATIGGTPLTLDVDSPSGGPSPVVIFLHSDGNWHRDHKKEKKFRSLVATLTEGGYAVVSPRYRAKENVQYPAPLEAAFTAVRWVRAHAGRYNFDPERIAVVGWSMGGYLSCILGTETKNDNFKGSEWPDQGTRVQAVVAFGAFTDLDYVRHNDNELGLLLSFVGWDNQKNATIDAETARLLSPRHRAAEGNPPFLLFHADQDPRINLEHSRRLRDRLKDLDVPAQLIEVQSSDQLWEGDAFDKSLQQARDFLDKHLRK